MFPPSLVVGGAPAAGDGDTFTPVDGARVAAELPAYSRCHRMCWAVTPPLCRPLTPLDGARRTFSVAVQRRWITVSVPPLIVHLAPVMPLHWVIATLDGTRTVTKSGGRVEAAGPVSPYLYQRP